MKKKLNENSIQNELSQGSAFFSKGKKEQPTSVTDVADRCHDVTSQKKTQAIDSDKLQTVISELSEITVSTHGTPVRLSEAEKQDIEDFIYITLRKKGISGKAVSNAKLMRYALRYLMKVHEKEFVEALKEALKKEEKLSI